MGGEPTAKPKGRKETTMELTMRNYHEAVIALFKGEETKFGITQEDVITKAEAELAKLDATNIKRSEKAAEKAKENEPLKARIFDLLLAKGTMTSPDIASALTAEGNLITTSKASAMCRQMVDDGRLNAEEVKIPKKGKLKAYSVVQA